MVLNFAINQGTNAQFNNDKKNKTPQYYHLQLAQDARLLRMRQGRGVER